MLDDTKQSSDVTDTFIGRLVDMSNKNPKFTTEDIFAETATILTGVRLLPLFLSNQMKKNEKLIFFFL